MRYDRAPSAAFTAFLQGVRLAESLAAPRRVAGVALDVHLRANDHIHIYCGLTRLVDARFTSSGLKVDAHSTYKKQDCGTGLFRTWGVSEAGLTESLDRYLAGVTVSATQTQSEGAIQAAWAKIEHPWIAFDREAVLGYDSRHIQQNARDFEAVREARAEISSAARLAGWAPLPKTKVGAELDQLGVDSDGHLVLIELKKANASPASVYYSPFQLLQYIHEWAAAYDRVKGQLVKLMETRRALGLSPSDMPDLTSGLRPVVAFGADKRSGRVRQRFDTVHDIVNRHLPSQATPIEVWAMRDGRPDRIA